MISSFKYIIHYIKNIIKNDGLTTLSNFMIMNEYEYRVFLRQLNEEQILLLDNFMFKKNLNVSMHLFLIGGVGSKIKN